MWFQRRTNGSEHEIWPDNGSPLSDSGKSGMFMVIINVGYGSYGEYVCKQKFDGETFETSFRLLPTDDCKCVFEKMYVWLELPHEATFFNPLECAIFFENRN